MKKLSLYIFVGALTIACQPADNTGTGGKGGDANKSAAPEGKGGDANKSAAPEGKGGDANKSAAPEKKGE